MKILHRKFLEPYKKGYERKKKCQNSIDTSAENTYFRTKKINIETLSKCGKKDMFIPWRIRWIMNTTYVLKYLDALIPCIYLPI